MGGAREHEEEEEDCAEKGRYRQISIQRGETVDWLWIVFGSIETEGIFRRIERIRVIRRCILRLLKSPGQLGLLIVQKWDTKYIQLHHSCEA